LISTAGLHAQSSQSREARIAAAKEAFAVGTRAYADGEFKTALTSFQRAYDLTGSPDLLYNIATVSDRMRRDEQALEAYEGYLEARPKSADREHVESRIDVLRAAIEARRRADLDAEIEADRAQGLGSRSVSEAPPLFQEPCWSGSGSETKRASKVRYLGPAIRRSKRWPTVVRGEPKPASR
jgi:tetratricopeptide (TPR) repeat protein